MRPQVRFNTANLIHDAAARGDVEAVSSQIKCGVDVNSRQSGWCPLHMACQNGHTNIVALLLKNGAQVNSTGQNGITALHLCAHKGFVQSSQMLLLFSANINAVDREGCTPLHYAAIWGQTPVVEVLIQRGAIVSIQNNDGWTPLHYASRHGHVNTVRVLCASGAELQIADSEGKTPRDVAFGNDVQRLFQAQNDAQESDQLVSVKRELATKEAELSELKQQLAQTVERLSTLEQTVSQTKLKTQKSPVVSLDMEEEDDFVFAPRSMTVQEITKVDLVGSDMLHGADETPRTPSTNNPDKLRDQRRPSVPDLFIHPRRAPNMMAMETSFS
eukprot:c2656_g1_i1.p1 GENE.c2656_g1_i1~~c2656_g1_i1.p1  ORF type:complete len:330 (+),score=56.55 c2656_g1_i1:49-1038(+)